jgi:hypothetical protein
VAKPNYESKKRLKSPLQGDKIKTKSSFVKNLIPFSLFSSCKKIKPYLTRRKQGGLQEKALKHKVFLNV